MTHDIENKLGRGLRELADVPVPSGLADGALTRARWVRRAHAVTGGLAAVAATGAIATPFLLWSSGGSEPAQFGAPPPPPVTASALAPTATPGAVGSADQDGCVEATAITGGVKQVAPGNWPKYVRIAMDRLPEGKNWVMQSGYGPCQPSERDTPNAYSVINLGPSREDGGHLTLYLADRRHHQLPRNCAEVEAEAAQQGADGEPRGEVVECTEGTASRPLFYAIDTSYGELHAAAVWADGRAVWMESIPNEGAPLPLDLDGLRTVVTDRELVDQLG
ncbi:hypothetical protein ACFFMR_12100 [Micromonospora andamanensis]|uniref:Uncharacterized protein n=1 Tax=Micromonospora andamanensis TaxID=1287068 RepID=A0ABQ4HTY2_9ACTN|nr:hypothetical protein [Micromonospora andamanensis]GIJ09065.1 hypothetical protein Van01_22790 [Micromonospora andamanensis]